ncbi:MAG: (d)CMP kinase [Bacteroidales bacterium]|nr:(d)CMP kinase [Bacteroidales bacterium]
MNLSDHKIIIALDGFSSCGKSTFAKTIAKRFNYKYIDSGAMYRAVTYLCLKHNAVNKNSINTNILGDLLNDVKIDFKIIDGNQYTFINDVNVEKEIRTIEISQSVSLVSANGDVREKLVEMQQKFGEDKGIVMDGRDIGTAVFPNAELKIFMTADPKVRAQRRYDELIAKGDDVNYDEIEENIVSRDYQDQNREISPLRKADDAIVLDNTYMTPEEQIIWLDKIVAEL